MNYLQNPNDTEKITNWFHSGKIRNQKDMQKKIFELENPKPTFND